MEIGKTIWKHAKIVGSCGAPDFFPKTLAYMAKKLNDPTRLITHRLPLLRVQEGFELGLKGTESAKVMIKF